MRIASPINKTVERYVKEVMVFSFSYLVLHKGISAGNLVVNSFRGQKLMKGMI